MASDDSDVDMESAYEDEDDESESEQAHRRAYKNNHNPSFERGEQRLQKRM